MWNHADDSAADTIGAITLTACPACQCPNFIEALPTETASDNSLGSLLSSGQPFGFNWFNPYHFARVNWSICEHCSLIFAAKRPRNTGIEEWYTSLLQRSEERTYNTLPLPDEYLIGKRESSESLFQLLDQNGLLASASTVIQFRTGPGFFLQIVREKYPETLVYGLEYFENPADYAAKLIGADRIRLIRGPEPYNPFPLEKFDLVVVNHFMTHAHNPGPYLTYLKSLLSPTGKLILYNELDHDLSLRSMRAYSRGLNFFHKQLFTRSTLAAFVKSRGLDAKEISKPTKDRPSKYITLVCCTANPAPIPQGDSGAARSLLKNWRRRHIFYRATGWLLDPIRQLIRANNKRK